MVRITLRLGPDTIEYAAAPGETVMDVLRRAGVAPDAPCGGRGTCGKCRVRIAENGAVREVLACQTPADRDMEIFLKRVSGGIIRADGEDAFASGESGFGMAVDLGTTTVAVGLYSLENGKLLGIRSDWNAQSPYGADVVTRMQYALEHPGGLALMGQLLRGQVLSLGGELCGECGVTFGEVRRVFVAGNTVMEHFWAEEPVRPIAFAPYEPKELFVSGCMPPLPEMEGAEILCGPCVSGYVGGDITAGLLAAGLLDREERSLFLDVGTNGEMALRDGDGFLCCSVACGPAFEGAEISCGMASLPGAVSHVSRRGEQLILDVIGDAEPRGICGSGLLDLLKILLELGVVDEGGRLLPPHELGRDYPWLEEDGKGCGIVYLDEAGRVYFTAGDVRKLQLAKAAVAAGIAVLLRRSGTPVEEVEHICLAGGFGSHLDPASAAAIGMIPSVLKNRVVSAGNTAFRGAAMALTDAGARKKLKTIRSVCRYEELSADAVFGDEFVQRMMFEDEEDIKWN